MSALCCDPIPDRSNRTRKSLKCKKFKFSLKKEGLRSYVRSFSGESWKPSSLKIHAHPLSDCGSTALRLQRLGCRSQRCQYMSLTNTLSRHLLRSGRGEILLANTSECMLYIITISTLMYHTRWIVVRLSMGPWVEFEMDSKTVTNRLETIC